MREGHICGYYVILLASHVDFAITLPVRILDSLILIKGEIYPCTSLQAIAGVMKLVISSLSHLYFLQSWYHAYTTEVCIGG